MPHSLPLRPRGLAPSQERAIDIHAVAEAQKELRCLLNGEDYQWTPLDVALRNQPLRFVTPIPLEVKK